MLKDVPFSHLHNKTQFSVLQSTIQVNNLIKKAVDEGMPAVAISDSGNMMAAFHFMEAVTDIIVVLKVKSKSLRK